MDYVAKALGSHLECPICTEVPRDGVMLTCLSGHSVCAVCLNKIGENPKCPLGRCDFGSPPASNITVANLVRSFPFKWPCKYQAEADCKFEGTSSTLDSHEPTCKKQLVTCVMNNCHHKSLFGAVIEHFRERHKRIGRVENPSSEQIHHWFASETSSIWRSESFSWCPLGNILTDQDGREHKRSFLLCSHRHEERLYVWLWSVTRIEEPEKHVGFLLLERVKYYFAFILVPVYTMSLLYKLDFTHDENRVMLKDFFAKTPISVKGFTKKQHCTKDFYQSVKTYGVYKN